MIEPGEPVSTIHSAEKSLTRSRTKAVRKSTLLFCIVAAQIVIVALLAVHGALSVADAGPRLAAESALVERLMLTDLTLFTEARYTRHLSQADLHTPFQDFPMALEHFPSGSFAQPSPSQFHRVP